MCYLGDFSKGPKISVLQANTKLVQKGEWWRFIRGLGSILTGGTILLLDFLFSRNKASDANIGIIVNLVHFEKNS